MARRRNGSRRHRRGRFGFIYKFLSVLTICAVIVVALTLFFKVGTIQISGLSHYTEEEVQTATGVQLGDNLFLLNKYDIANRIVEKLPYIETVRINRKLPDLLLIDVQECSSVYALAQDGMVYKMSTAGKIVDSAKGAALPTDVPVIDGVELLSPTVGQKIALSREQSTVQESLLALLAALDQTGVTDQVNAIHLSDSAVVTMEYGDRFAVLMPYEADYPHLLKYLSAVIGTLETNQTGTIDLTKDGEPHFRPN